MKPLSVDNLALRAGARTLVDGLSATIAAGEVWCIAGPNGAGKTTLIGVLAGIAKPASGAITLGGARLRRGARRTSPGNAR